MRSSRISQTEALIIPHILREPKFYYLLVDISDLGQTLAL